MRFIRLLPHGLTALLAAAPLWAGAQTAHIPPANVAGTANALPLASSSEIVSSAGAAVVPASGCGHGYSGYVRAREQVLAGASVLVKGTGVAVVTNSEGFFVLPSSVTGWPTLAVSAMGYEPLTLAYRTCEPLTVELMVLPTTKFKKHGRKKGFVVLPKHH